MQITAGTSSNPMLKETVPEGQVPVILSHRSAISDLLEGGGTVLTIIGVVILLSPVLVRTWREFKHKAV